MCGVFGIFDHPHAKILTIEGISSLQHRGQDACGLASYEFMNSRTAQRDYQGRKIRIRKNKGLVSEVLTTEAVKDLNGTAYIAHVRWPTQGDDSTRNVQPHYTQCLSGRMAIVSNGDIVNMRALQQELAQHKVRIYSENDAEIISAQIHSQITLHDQSLVDAIRTSMSKIKGSYSALIMTEFELSLYAFRDPMGIRPLFIGTRDGKFCFASETCALQAIDAELYVNEALGIYGEVPPGAIVQVSREGIHVYPGLPSQKRAFCIFEYIYFSRPDSIAPHFLHQGLSFQYCREQLGAHMAKQDKQGQFDADIVVPVPKGGIPGALGYANESGIPLAIGIIENPKLHGLRTFIESDRKTRGKLAHKKYNFLKDIIRGKRVVVVDDSIVRGLTTGWVVSRLWEAGAREVHIRIPSPPYAFGCHYGVETRERNTLIAGRFVSDIDMHDTAVVSAKVGGAISRKQPTSLRYLSIAGMFKAIGIEQADRRFCYACFNGQYPVPLEADQ